MAKRKFRFVATELRDCINTANYFMQDGDIMELDEDNVEHAKCIKMFTGEDREHDKSDNFIETTRGAPTVVWEDLPEDVDPIKRVERFKRDFLHDKVFRRQAEAQGIRVLAAGERD